jgi:hypothetical protein
MSALEGSRRSERPAGLRAAGWRLVPASSWRGWQMALRRLGTESSPDSPLEGSGFEPSVPLPRLSSIRAVRAEIIGRSTDVFRRDREFDVSALQGHLLPRSVFDRPGSDRWNLASTTFPDAGPIVRIRFPPAGSQQRTWTFVAAEARRLAGFRTTALARSSCSDAIPSTRLWFFLRSC